MPPAPEAPVQPGPAMPTPQPQPPTRQIKTNRTVLKYILLGIITLGIYDIVITTGISRSINTIATKHDGKKTMNFCWNVFIFSWLTLGIVPLIWWHRISERIGDELQCRGHQRIVTATDFWIWNFACSGVGLAIVEFALLSVMTQPFIAVVAALAGLIIELIGIYKFYSKFFKATNTLAADYNTRG